MFTLTIAEIQKIWADIANDGLIPTIDELVLRARQMEDKFLDDMENKKNADTSLKGNIAEAMDDDSDKRDVVWADDRNFTE